MHWSLKVLKQASMKPVCSMIEEWLCSAMCLFFGPDQRKIDEFIKELKVSEMALTVEDNLYTFVGVADKAAGKVTMTQSGLMKKC
jgi:hypothetical protein